MKIFYPPYYNDFCCLAGDCPDSCCKEWTVDIDPETAEKYRAIPGPLGDRLRQVLAVEDGSTIMVIQDGRCPMWRSDGLCRIQAELNHDALCRTCREYPRLRHDYGDFVELGLELSCPEAARLILTSPNAVMLSETHPHTVLPEYDVDAMTILLRSRAAVLDFLDSPHPIPQKLAAVLLYAHSIQAELDSGETENLLPENCLEDTYRYTDTGNMTAVFAFFRSLEILTDRWHARLDQQPIQIQWSDPLLALARYMVQRYWLHAVSDYDLVCRVKFCIVSCLLVGALGGDLIQTAQLFSKEIENDPDNVEAILNGAYSSPALTDTNLFSLLLR